ncbi:MAG: type II toxin-antitoxin system PemK/MazF family toxin [Clostridia bacterium]|nr:type II toxin-antitoxin system PemK/MazF family toxin [Clostridia bacterium]
MMNLFSQGDIVYLDFNPQSGHEQRGRRPAIIITNNLFNRFSKMLMVCPITNTDKKHPFHIKLDARTKTTGTILCDQARTLDVYARNAVFVEKAPCDIIDEAVHMIMSFLERNESE